MLAGFADFLSNIDIAVFLIWASIDLGNFVTK